MTDFTNSVIGMAGASGHLGRAVIGYLQARGAKHIVAVTRDPSKLAGLTGIDVRQGDFDAPASLDIAFKGIERLLVISTDTIGVPGGRVRQHVAAIDAAERAGVSHIAYTSITSPHPSDTALVASDHFWTEARITQLKTDWTILRNNVYIDYLDVPRIVTSGQLVTAAGEGRKALVTRDDCAAAAAGALLTATGKTVENVSGPAALSQADIAAAVSKIYGTPIAVVGITGEQLIAGMIQGGLPEMLAKTFAAFDTDAIGGSYGITSDAVARLAGRPPQSLEGFLAKNLKPTAA